MHYHSGEIIVQAYPVHNILSDICTLQLQRLPDWMSKVVDRGLVTASLHLCNHKKQEFVFVHTLHGTVKAFDGDWIALHEEGNVSRWNDDAFKAMWKKCCVALEMVGGPYDGRIIEHPNKQFPEAEISDHFCLIEEGLGSKCFHYFRIGDSFKYAFRQEQKSDPNTWPKHVVHPNKT